MTRPKDPRTLLEEYLHKIAVVPRSFRERMKAKIDDLYTHVDAYDVAYKGQRGDKKFYVQKAAEGRVLYLGVGSGRIFKNIASINADAYGLDYSPHMTASSFWRGRVKDRLIFADVLKAKIKRGSFDTIIAPFCFLNQFEHRAVETILQNCFRWLKPCGTLVTDFFSPFRNPSIKNFLRKKRTERGIRIESFELYDFVDQKLLELTFIHGKKERMLLTLPLHYYYPNEIARMFRAAGFTIDELHGGFGGGPLTMKSDAIVVVVEKPRQGAA